MFHGWKIFVVVSRVALASIALLFALSSTESLAQFEPRRSSTVEQTPTDVLISADDRGTRLETNSIIGAALCFAVGFAACFAIVHSMLPGLVRAQCLEIVREYLDYAKPSSDVRVVVLDRESREPLKVPRRTMESSVAQTPQAESSPLDGYRLDKPRTAPTPESTTNEDASSADSMLSQIYEQNVHLRDQLHKQSRRVRQ